MDFSISAEHAELQERTRRFIAEYVIPMEGDARCTPHGPTDGLRDELVAKAKKAAADAPDVMQAMMVLQQQKPRKMAQKPPTRLL